MNNEEFAQKNTCRLKKVLVTGASGFIGSFLVEGGLERDMQVWAGVRKSSSRAYLKDPRIQFAELDFAHPGRLSNWLFINNCIRDGIISFIVPVLLNAVIKTNSTKVIMFIPVIL